MNWEYVQPVRIIFGAGEIKKLAVEIRALGGHKGIMITSKGFLNRGLVAQVQHDCDGLVPLVYSQVSPNPTVGECDACATMMRNNHCDFVVALGGGSVMDCAKAAATFCLTENRSTEFLATGKPIPQRHLPIIAVPTTAGTASEVTSVSVLSDHARQVKAPLSSFGFYPDLALVDPVLTHTVPPYLTACTGFDVLCHATESYWSKHHQPICETLSVRAAKLVMENLEQAYNHGDDAVARERMAEASLVAGLAFSLPKTTSSHACSYPLTNSLGIPHGEACAMTISHFIRFNAEHGCQRIEHFAHALGYTHAHEYADEIDGMRERMGMQMDLKAYHLTQQQFNDLVKASQHPNLLNNPVEVTECDLREMYLKMVE